MRYSPPLIDNDAILRENEQLRAQLEEAQSALRAIRSGEVDALVVEENDQPSIRHIVDEEILAQSILEQVADAVVICNENGQILRASRAVQEKYDSHPYHKPFDSVFCLFTPGKKERLHFETLLQNENLSGYEVVAQKPDEDYYLLLNVGILRSDHGVSMGAVITLTDITTQKRAEAALMQADRRKDEFLATLAHELRNPLAPLNNALNMLQMGARGAMVGEAQAMMARQLKQMVRLVDDLLDVSRISRNVIELRKQVVTFREILESAIETSKPLIDSQEHRLHLNVPQNDVYLNGDPTRLAQIFSNLLNNAAKYTPPGGDITLSASVKENRITVRIRDTGIGIEQSMLPAVFDMFLQVDNSLERSHGGLGIGLSLVKNLIDLHGGKVEAFSAGLKKGSEFVVTLPTATPLSKPEAAIPQQVQQHSLHRVLVVDDNVPSAKTMGWMLEMMGHETCLIHHSDEVMESLRQFKPDIVLLDIGLPGKSGYEICREIRSKPEYAHLKLIAQTGWGQEKDKARAREAGFNDHLVKPVDIKHLENALAANSVIQ